jgi:hypothetical protein
MNYPILVIICTAVIILICIGCHCWGFMQGMKRSEEIWARAFDDVHKRETDLYGQLRKHNEESIKSLRPPT